MFSVVIAVVVLIAVVLVGALSFIKLIYRVDSDSVLLTALMVLGYFVVMGSVLLAGIAVLATLL